MRPTRPRRTRTAVAAALGAGLVLPALLGSCTLPGAALHDGEGITGTYVVNGVDPVGIEYSGTVVITGDGERTDRYRLEWIVTGTIQEGVGTLDGDRLEVGWTDRLSPRGAAQATSGTATYTVADDGALHGTRVIDGVEGTGTEDIFPEP
ncbi:MAG: hypothetical protein AB7W59_32605 [Acidimicrobiia bacterium]